MFMNIEFNRETYLSPCFWQWLLTSFGSDVLSMLYIIFLGKIVLPLKEFIDDYVKFV